MLLISKDIKPRDKKKPKCLSKQKLDLGFKSLTSTALHLKLWEQMV